MHEQQRSLARQAMQGRQLSAALFAGPATITWLTGFAPPVQLGPSVFEGGPPLLWYEDGRFTLIVMDKLADSRAQLRPRSRCRRGYLHGRHLSDAA